MVAGRCKMQHVRVTSTALDIAAELISERCDDTLMYHVGEEGPVVPVGEDGTCLCGISRQRLRGQ